MLAAFLYYPWEFASWMCDLERYLPWLFLLLLLLIPVAHCKAPPSISNGKHNAGYEDAYPYGSSVTYSCNPSFSMVGDASISCTVENKTKGVWSPSPPTCKSKSQLNCLAYPLNFSLLFQRARKKNGLEGNEMIQRQTTSCHDESQVFGQLILMHAVPLHSNKQHQ